MLAGIHAVTSVFAVLFGADIRVQTLLQRGPLQALARLSAFARDLPGSLSILELFALRAGDQQRASPYHDRDADQGVCQTDLLPKEMGAEEATIAERTRVGAQV